jgi:hypothetical protein
MTHPGSASEPADAAIRHLRATVRTHRHEVRHVIGTLWTVALELEAACERVADVTRLVMNDVEFHDGSIMQQTGLVSYLIARREM